MSPPPSSQRTNRAPFAVLRADAAGLCTEVNDRWVELTGLTLAESRGEGWTSALHLDDRAWVSAAWTTSAREPTPLQCECRLRRRNATIWVIVLALPIDEDLGGGLAASIIDITDRKRAEARLALQNRANGILAASPKLEVAARELVALTAEAFDCAVAELWWIDDETAVLCNLAQAVAEVAGRLEFVEASRSTTFAKGIGLPGRAWSSQGEPGAVVRTGEAGDLHSAFVRRHRLAAALAIPIAPDGRVLGVVVVAFNDETQETSDTIACLQGVFSQLGNMIERKRIEEARRRAEELFRYVALATRDAIYDWHIVENVVWRNESYRALYAPDDPIGSDGEWWEEHLHPDERERVTAGLAAALASGADVWVDEYRLQRGDGTYAEILDRGHILYEAGKPARMIGAMTDISALRASLRDKEVLLKELHHRVKNNLQIISSLLSLQSQRATDGDAREMFRESQKRVRAMALVHENLYRGADFSTVDVAQFLRALTSNVLRLHGADAGRIALDLQVDDVEIEVETAIPCALLVNELLTNCLKHAFRGRDRGVIVLALRNAREESIALVVADDGVGMPEHVDAASSDTLGLDIVRTLVGQLHGRLEVVREKGTRFEITFQRIQSRRRTSRA